MDLNDIFNWKYSGHAKKMPSKPAKCEGQTFAQKSCTLKNLETDNKVQLSAPTNFIFKPPEFRSGALIAQGPKGIPFRTTFTIISDTNTTSHP